MSPPEERSVAGLARPLTPCEKTDYRLWYPCLNVGAVIVTDEVSSLYNCVSWTLGVKTVWHWPSTGCTLADFDGFYSGFGFTQSTGGEIAAWGVSSSEMMHTAISGPGHGPRWESKDGGGLRFQHGIDELNASAYSRVIAYYKKTGNINQAFQHAWEAYMSTDQTAMFFTQAERDAISAVVSSLPPAIQAAYAAAFAAWRATWFQGRRANFSNPATRKVGIEFDALIALGPRIVPLVVESLTDPANFMALQLYDTIQEDVSLIVRFASTDPRIVTGEQGRARETVKIWLSSL